MLTLFFGCSKSNFSAIFPLFWPEPQNGLSARLPGFCNPINEQDIRPDEFVSKGQQLERVTELSTGRHAAHSTLDGDSPGQLHHESPCKPMLLNSGKTPAYRGGINRVFGKPRFSVNGEIVL